MAPSGRRARIVRPHAPLSGPAPSRAAPIAPHGALDRAQGPVR